MTDANTNELFKEVGIPIPDTGSAEVAREIIDSIPEAIKQMIIDSGVGKKVKFIHKS